jgi:anti-anti-sigma factor
MSEQVLDSADDAARVNAVRIGAFGAEVEPGSSPPVVHLSGELDMATAPALDEVVTSALRSRPSALVLDAAGLTFLDSTGIHLLMKIGQAADAIGCSLVLRSPRRAVLKVLRITGTDALLVIDPPPEEGPVSSP